MGISSKKLTEKQLRILSNYHDRLINNMHRWCWLKLRLPEIWIYRLFNPRLSNQELFEFFGGNFVDWLAQEKKDDKDWYESLNTVVITTGLNEVQTAELRSYISGYTE